MSFTVEIVGATSLDGRISTWDRHPWRWSDPEDHEWLLSRMAAADLLVTGSGTIDAENPTVTVPREWAERRTAEGKPAQPVRLVLTPGLSIRPGRRALRVKNAKLLLAAHPRSIERRGSRFADAVLLPWEAPFELRPILTRALRHAAGTRIVCLGGGHTNAGFLEEDLVDRISLTISSFVIGSKRAPGLFEGRGFAPGTFPQFRIIEERRAGRDRILVYERDRGAEPRDAAHGLH